MNRSTLVLFVLIVLFLAPWAAAQEDSAAAGSSVAGAGTVEARFDAVPKAAAEGITLSTLEQLERLKRRTGEAFPMPSPIHPESDLGALAPTEPPTGLATGELPTKAEKAADDLALFLNNEIGAGAPSYFVSGVDEPSVGMSGDVVFYSGNWFTSLSTDGGETFTFVNPFQGPFPAVNDGFCCDQIVIHDSEHDAIYYLQQYINDSSSGTQRINVDRGADGDFDCAWDFDPQDVGNPDGRWFDYPDLVQGETFLYHSTNIFRTSDDTFTGSVVLRYSRAELAACGSTLSYEYLVRGDGSPRLTHGAGTTMFWATHPDNRTVRVYRWADSSDTIFWQDRQLDPWNTSGYDCPGPDGTNACGRSDDRILAGYVAGEEIGFLWNSAQGGAYPYPYITFARFQKSDRSLIVQNEIWNSTFAWIYPSVSVNERGDLGGTIFFSGGDYHPSCAAWVRDASTTNLLDAVLAAAGTDGPTRDQLGDYLSARPHPEFPNTWIGTCYSFQGGGNDSDVRPQLTWFGRLDDGPAQSGPANDNFGKRIAVGGEAGTTTGTNEDATKQTGERRHAGNSGGASVWWAWRAPRGGQVTIDTVGSTFDTLLGVYTGKRVNSLTKVAANDDLSISSRASRVVFNARKDVTYKIAVDGYGGAMGDVVLNWIRTAATVCTPSTTTACLAGGRFEVTVEWNDGQGNGVGRLVPVCVADGAAVFYFTDSDRWEMTVRVVDGCSANNRFWVFAGSLTDVEYTLRVTDMESGAVKTYGNTLGTVPRSVIDRRAFSGCP